MPVARDGAARRVTFKVPTPKLHELTIFEVPMRLAIFFAALVGGFGIFILASDRVMDRDRLVAKYKAGLDDTNLERGRFLRTELAVDVGAGNRVTLQRYEGSEAINGFTGDLPAPTAATFGWTALVDATETWVVHQTIDGAVPSAGGSFVIPRLSVAVPASTQLVCTPENFDGNTGTCPDAFLQAMCHDISGDPTAGQVNKDPAVKGECPRDNVICGTCDFTYYLNTRVEYLVWSGAPESRWRMPANLGWARYPQGLRYPFNLSDQEFTFEFKNPMNLTLKPIGDPYSLVQNLTGRDMDFGETEDEQRKTGLLMIAVGSLTFLICTGAMAGMRYMTAKANKEKEAAAKEAAKALNDKNAAGGGAPADSYDAHNNNGGVGGDGAAAANNNSNHQSGGQGNNNTNNGGGGNGGGNNGGGGWNGGGDQGGWGNGRGGADDGGARNPMNQFNGDGGNGRGGGGNDGRGGGGGGDGGWGNPQRGGRGNNNNGGGNDDDFKALGPGAAGNRYNNNRNARGGQDRRGASGYGRGGGNNQRRNSSGNNSGSGGGGGGSSNGNNQSSGNGSRNARGGGFQSNEDSRSQRSGGSGSAQIAQALRRGPPAGRSSGGHASGGGGGGRRRSNSRNRQYNRIEDDPDL
jgi:hypothetical protein